ncbi:MAG: CDP-alcohol phosphatidyltransferase family protein [Spirochaetota bacterium]|nr:CDP-alcohol phosphatidyltransferase family protein [Spirochaetota bacterium]
MNKEKTKAIIFANKDEALLRLWGMTLYEKILRQLSSINIEECILIANDFSIIKSNLRKDFKQWNTINIKIQQIESNEIKTLTSILKNDDSNFLVIQGNAVFDSRILQYLQQELEKNHFKYVTENDNLSSPFIFSVCKKVYDFDNPRDYKDLKDLFSKNPSLDKILTKDMDCYIVKLRKHLVPYLLEVRDKQSLKKAKLISFNSVYKGAVDFVTKYIYPIPVRIFVGLISPTYLTPNQITLFSISLAFGSIPFYFLGWYWLAICMGVVMSFLDSVDGKLARLTMRTTTSGRRLDHISDRVYLPIWYLGVGWSLAEGNMLNFNSYFVISTWLLVVIYIIDRIMIKLFRKLYNASINDYTKLDYYVRIFIARRNAFLMTMIIGLVFSRPDYGFFIFVFWQIITFFFHLFRFIYLPLSKKEYLDYTLTS